MNRSMASLMLLLLISVSLASRGTVMAAGTVVIDPDAFPSGTILNNAFPGVTLSAHDLPVGAVLPNNQVQSLTSTFTTTGSRGFAHTEPGQELTWGNGLFEYLRADFAAGASEVTLDFIANDSGGDTNAQLLAFNAANVLVDVETVALVAFGSPMTLGVTAPNISYVFAYWDEIGRAQNGALDHLTYTPVPEPAGVALAAVALLMVTRFRLRNK